MNRVKTSHLVVICVTLILVVTSIGYFSLESNKIEKDKAIQQGYISQKQEEIRQKEETERTEERSQFWQKLIPWGSDEQETNE